MKGAKPPKKHGQHSKLKTKYKRTLNRNGQHGFKNYLFGKLISYLIGRTLDMLEGEVEIPRKLDHLFNEIYKVPGRYRGLSRSLYNAKKSFLQQVTAEDEGLKFREG